MSNAPASRRTASRKTSKKAPQNPYVVHVSGCGSVGARGVYRATSQKRNSQPVFMNENGFALSRENLDAVGWIIGKQIGGMHCAHYVVMTPAKKPPSTGWMVFEGGEPPPMVVVKSSAPKGGPRAHHTHVGARGVTPQQAENSRQRNKLYEHIIHSERAYTIFLGQVLSFVVDPMKAAQATPKGLQQLVKGFTDILQSNKAITNYIQQNVETRPSNVMSTVFIEHAEGLKSYVRYYTQFPSFLGAARKCLGDLRSLGAVEAFNGATLPVILFRPVLRMFEYEIFVRNMLKFTGRRHEFRAKFEAAHGAVLAALSELRRVMQKDSANHVGVLMKVCGEMRMPSLILPGRRYNSTWRLRSVSAGTHQVSGPADLHVFTDMVCFVSEVGQGSAPSAADREMKRPAMVIYHCDLTAVKLLARSPIHRDADSRSQGSGTVSVHFNNPTLKAPSVYNIEFESREDATDFVKAFDALLRAPEVRFSLPASEESYPTVKFFIAPPPPPGADHDTSGTDGKQRPKSRNWASHRKKTAMSGTINEFKAAVENKARKHSSGGSDSTPNGTQQQKTPQSSSDAYSDDDGDEGSGGGGGKEAAPDNDCKYRLRIYDELVSTEKTYIDNLHILVTQFKHSMQELVDIATLNKIFGTCEEILGVNTKLLSEITKSDASDTGTLTPVKASTVVQTSSDEEKYARRLFNAFLKLLPYLKMYGTYCNSYADALACVEETSKSNERVKKFIERKTKELQMNMDSYLILPAQRFCKYPLFFRDILAHTPANHPCYKDALKVKTRIDEGAQLVNELVSNYQRRQRVAEIQQRVSGVDKLLKADRLYLTDFKVQLTHSDGSGKEKWRKVTLFVFSDVLVVAKPDKTLFVKKGTLKYHNLIRWEELELTPESDEMGPLDLHFEATQKSETNTTVTHYKLRCKDRTQKEKLREKFSELTQDLTDRRQTLKRRQDKGKSQRGWQANKNTAKKTWRSHKTAERNLDTIRQKYQSANQSGGSDS